MHLKCKPWLGLLFFLLFTNNSFSQSKYLIPYLNGSLYGFCDEFGNIKIKPAFLDVELFNESKTYVFDQNGFRNLIDTTGKLLLPSKYIKIEPVDYFYAFSISRCSFSEDSIDVVNLGTGQILNTAYIFNVPKRIDKDYSNTELNSRYYIINGVKKENCGIYDIQQNKFIYKGPQDFVLENYHFDFYKKKDSLQLCVRKYQPQKSALGDLSTKDSIAFIDNGRVGNFFEINKLIASKEKKPTSESVTVIPYSEKMNTQAAINIEPHVFYQNNKVGFVYQKNNKALDTIVCRCDSIYLPESFFSGAPNLLGVKNKDKWGILEASSGKMLTEFDYTKKPIINNYSTFSNAIVTIDSISYLFTPIKTTLLGNNLIIKKSQDNDRLFSIKQQNNFGALYFPYVTDSITAQSFLLLQPSFSQEINFVITAYPYYFSYYQKSVLNKNGLFLFGIRTSKKSTGELIANQFGSRIFRKLIGVSGVKYYNDK